MRSAGGLFLVVTLLVAAGCLNDTLTSSGSTQPESIPSAPKTVPFTAHEENTIECIEPTPDCLPGPDGIGHFSFPGTIEGDHIGAGTIAGTSQVNFFAFPFEQSGQSTITAANGDQLVFSYEGTAVPGPADGDVVFGGDFAFVGGTGRFANASGGGTYAGTANTIAQVGQFDMVGEISR